MSSALTIAVVNFNSSDVIGRLVESVPSRVEILLVDNFSSNSERERVTSMFDDRVAVIPSANHGFAAGVNLAARVAPHDHWLLVCNPDAYFEPGAVVELINQAIARGLDLASPLVLRSSDRSIWFGGGDVNSRFEVTHESYGRYVDEVTLSGETGFVSGCCLLISPSARASLFPMREDLFMYYEDVELSLRALREGQRLGVVTTAVAMHEEGHSSKSVEDSSPTARSTLYYFYQCRNRYILHAESAGAVPAGAASALFAIRQLIRICRNERSRRSKMGAVARGTVVGFQAARRSSTRHET